MFLIEFFILFVVIMYTVTFTTLTWEWSFMFETQCKTIEEARIVSSAIADFSNYEIESRLKPDYSSVCRIVDEHWYEVEEDED